MTNPSLEKSGFTPGPWEYIASTEHHGAYVVAPYGGDICDCYTMSNPSSLSVRNGGDSKHIAFQGELSDANARLISCAPELYEALKEFADACSGYDEEEDLTVSFEILLRARAALSKAVQS